MINAKYNGYPEPKNVKSSLSTDNFNKFSHTGYPQHKQICFPTIPTLCAEAWIKLKFLSAGIWSPLYKF